jgi:hypothetical protein
LDALALSGLFLVVGSVAIALVQSTVIWIACIGVILTLGAIGARGLVVRKLGLLSHRTRNRTAPFG